MKLDPSIIALKDFENNTETRLKLARYSTATQAPSINASEQNIICPICTQHDAQCHWKLLSSFYNMASNFSGQSQFVHNMYRAIHRDF